MLNELEVNFTFTDSEKDAITEHLLTLNVNPYKFYPTFKYQVRQVIASLPQFERFLDFMEYQHSVSSYDFPFVFIENCPMDPELPELGNDNPVQVKYEKKKTFVAESFLQLYAELAAQHPISYINVNDGDVFQDILTKESLRYTQSQKSGGTIYFHKDFPNHFVRPDFVNILSLRSYDKNEIYNTFVSNKDILTHLSKEAMDTLRLCEFYTPYDDITVSTSTIDLGRAPNHTILVGRHHMRLFENRTVGLTPKAQSAVDELLTVAHAYKKTRRMRSGDFVAISNNLSLHGRDMHQITNIAESNRRWSLKTVNVQCCAPHLKHFVAGTDYLVNG
ncbi:MAG: hypothetical protein H0U75_07810 [Legionella sp.]|nr:hypothetical protein [Legionella sp.]